MIDEREYINRALEAGPELATTLVACLLSGAHSTTLTTKGPWPKGLGVRPELLSDNGTHRVWSLTRRQVAQFLATDAMAEAWGELGFNIPGLITEGTNSDD